MAKNTEKLTTIFDSDHAKSPSGYLSESEAKKRGNLISSKGPFMLNAQHPKSGPWHPDVYAGVQNNIADYLNTNPARRTILEKLLEDPSQSIRSLLKNLKDKGLDIDVKQEMHALSEGKMLEGQTLTLGVQLIGPQILKNTRPGEERTFKPPAFEVTL